IPAAPAERNVLPLIRGVLVGRAVLERRTIQVGDLQADSDEYPEGSALARNLGHRTVLSVPLMHAGEAIGAITIRQIEARLFTDRQINLLKTFADQAVIAIENTRLFEAEHAVKRELQESLEYQTATAEVLGVLSRSPTDVQPVFDAIAKSAANLCNAFDAAVLRLEGNMLRLVAHHGPMPIGDIPLHRGTAGGRSVIDRRLIHVEDLQAEEVEYPEGSAFAKQLGHRTTLSVPLVREGAAIGTIQVRRDQVQPCGDKQIALLQIFADQAVIAIENTRLFEAEQASKRELQESLEYQTAISEVLNVISRSPSDIQPVLDTIVRTAERLCEPDYALIFKQADDGSYHLAANSNASPAFVEWLRDNPIRAGDGSVVGIVLVEKRTVHLPDALADARFTDFRRLRQANARTLLAVPLLREGNPIGVINLLRRKVQPFSQKQIDLVTTFADQAVIAIENPRLFEEVQARTKELQDSLDGQTATSEVLGVISRSPNEVQPVLDTIMATAQRLCQAERGGIWLLKGETFRAVAHRGQPEALVGSIYSARPPVSRGNMVGRATLARRAVQVEDVATDPEMSAESHAFYRAANVQTLLAVPLLLKDHPIGVITLARTRVAPFDDKQVALVESFADQAVIAIENSRLFEAEQASKRELTEALDERTATADVLKVISRSALDLQKVLDALVESAARLCNAHDAAIFQLFGDSGRLVAHHGRIPTSGPVGQLIVPL